MSDPNAAVVVAAGAGAGLVGLLSGENPEAAVGALFGALIYFTTTRELPLLQRALFFVASFFMGYLFAPSITDIQLWGIRPFAFPGPAAFLASLMVVTVSLAALRAKLPTKGASGEQ